MRKRNWQRTNIIPDRFITAAQIAAAAGIDQLLFDQLLRTQVIPRSPPPYGWWVSGVFVPIWYRADLSKIRSAILIEVQRRARVVREMVPQRMEHQASAASGNGLLEGKAGEVAPG